MFCSIGQSGLREDLAMTAVTVLSLLFLQLHTNYLFTHACSTLTGCKMLLFLSLLTQFLLGGPSGWKVSAKVSVLRPSPKFSMAKGPWISWHLGLLIFEGCFLPRCCTKQPQLHQTTLNYEIKGHLQLGILIFSLEKSNKTFDLRWCLRVFFLSTSVWNDKFFNHSFLGYILNVFASAFSHERWRFLRRLPAGCNHNHTVPEVCCRCRACIHTHAHTPLSTTIPPKRVFLL